MATFAPISPNHPSPMSRPFQDNCTDRKMCLLHRHSSQCHYLHSISFFKKKSVSFRNYTFLRRSYCEIGVSETKYILCGILFYMRRKQRDTKSSTFLTFLKIRGVTEVRFQNAHSIWPNTEIAAQLHIQENTIKITIVLSEEHFGFQMKIGTREAIFDFETTRRKK